MAERAFRVAMVGATGAVGQVLLEILREREFPISELIPLASARSAGSRIKFGNQMVLVKELESFDFSGVDFAFFSAGGSVSRAHAPRAAAAGAIVIDNTSEFRLKDDVPLIVTEVNGELLDSYRGPGIIANPNCSTMQLVVAIAPLHRAATIERINIATYQSASGAGAKALEELAQQTAALLNFKEPKVEKFPVQLAFNLIPQIGDFLDNGYTQEEMKLIDETRKILNAPDIQVNPTVVRVPVFYGHSEAVHLETRTKLTAEAARKLLKKAPGVKLVDSPKPGGYPTPVTHAAGKDPVFVGRIREDLSHPRGLNLWVVADNIRKGAALNAVQIAERLIQRR
jgi:aspartate-semialdehyde dehydrogenase